MKTFDKTLAIVWTASLFASVLSAQTVTHEKYEEENGIGFSKYIVSNATNENGEYMLRMESFVTGSARKVTIPTDFVLALDNSGSMNYDYYIDGDDAIISTANYLTETQGAQLLIPDDGNQGTRYAYRRSTDQNISAGQRSDYFLGARVFDVETESIFDVTVVRWYHYVSGNSSNNGYYRIRRYDHKVKVGDKTTTYLNLRIKLKDGTYKYLWNTSLQNNPTTNVPVESTYQQWRWIDGGTQEQDCYSNKIIYRGSNIYRYRNSRVDELVKGINRFIEMVAEENAKDQWADGVTRNQIAMVAFGYPYYINWGSATSMDDANGVNRPIQYTGSARGYMTSADDITEYSRKDWATKVIKSFTEVNATNVTALKNIVPDRMNFCGGTATHCGVHLALKLFQELQGRDSHMRPLNDFGELQRNKVLIVFTDGEPSVNDANFYQVVSPALAGGRTVKTARVSPSGSEINGQLYCIDFAPTAYTEPFLRHLSSDYPSSDVSNANGNNASQVTYSGSQISNPYYYKDLSSSTTMQGIFSDIVTEVFADVGHTTAEQNTLSRMVMKDKLSDYFMFPGTMTGKVKFYTAQCIGTKEIDGEEYLAFASPVLAPNRASLTNLWVSEEDGSGAIHWYNKGSGGTGALADIDGPSSPVMTYSVSGNTITVDGFDFGELWCGLDAIPEHQNNTRQLESTDPNYAYQKDGYRGFKLIAEFPIVPAANIVGGPNVPTNDTSLSGIYVADSEDVLPDTPTVVYATSADVPVPVTLIIRKTGLKEGDSASFTIQRQLAGSNMTSSGWEDYSSFVLTGSSSGIPEIKFFSMDPAYHYRIKETAWGWSYSGGAMTIFPSTEDPTLTNPITLSNTLQESGIKHTEAKKTNVLTTSN